MSRVSRMFEMTDLENLILVLLIYQQEPRMVFGRQCAIHDCMMPTERQEETREYNSIQLRRK
eukprot:2722999-Amphidinium_carterae.1